MGEEWSEGVVEGKGFEGREWVGGVEEEEEEVEVGVGEMEGRRTVRGG